MLSAFVAHSPLAYLVVNIDPVALKLGSLEIRWYGLAYVLAISIALAAILRSAELLGISRDHVWNIFLGTAIAGLIGARLYFVIQQPDLVETYLKHPINILAVWNGGMAFFGAIFFGAPTAAYLAWRGGLSPWIALDLGGLFAAVGQMFGRLGNLVNGDIVGYAAGHPLIPGSVCQNAPCIASVADAHVLPWATAYVNPNNQFTTPGIPYQPAAAYEILINLAALAILWPLRLILPKRLQGGAFFSLYVVFYSIGQFLVFFARSNIFVSFLGSQAFKQAQWTAIFTFVGIVLFYWLVIRRFSKPWQYDLAHPAPPLRSATPQTAVPETEARPALLATTRHRAEADPVRPKEGSPAQP
ncbi:MAG: prolipoprotein diacylglyceryl transferase [Ktedonobacterales bacterium]|nr:prolipoprotein diacylglyceryl transferase [Ktedonobacterales bacterium]